MGNRLNQQSPLCRLIDSLKKQRKIEDRMASEVFYEGELENIKVLGKKKTIDELPILIRVGIAKWFVDKNLFCVDVEEILKIGINYSSFIRAKKIRKYFNTKYPNVATIDPVAKCYMTKNEIKELTGYDYIKEPTNHPRNSLLTRKKNKNDKIFFSKKGSHLRKLSLAGTPRKCKKNKQKKIKPTGTFIKKNKSSLYIRTINEIRKYLG